MDKDQPVYTVLGLPGMTISQLDELLPRNWQPAAQVLESAIAAS